ncbi:MAG: 2-phospho-L-lactate guanylyltransferase [Propionibacteriaceae bacterium]
MDTPRTPGPVGAVVALKPTQYAKSRLDTVAAPLRRRIAWSMAVDTLAALSAAVDRVLVVGDQPALESRLRRLGLAVTVVPEPGAVGMNGALRHGDATLRGLGCTTVLACVGDLPALRPESVLQIVSAARPFRRSFVADASGVGTTVLVANGTELDPRFQGRSAAAHRSSGAVALDADLLGSSLADARRDVDTEVDLHDAFHLGLGRATAALVDPATGRLGRGDVVTVTDQRSDSGDQIVITSAGYRIQLPAAALQDGIRHVRPGQRLHVVTDDSRVLAAWW